MAGRHPGPETRDELAPGVLMRALGVGVEDEGAAAGDRADPAPSAARARLAVAAAVAGAALLAGVLGPGAGAGQNSVESQSNVPAAKGVAGSVESQGDSLVKTRKFGSDVVLGAAAAAAVSMSALAGDAVQWRVEDGGNGHWYQRIDTLLNWTAAKAYCESRGGHLVTLINAAEQQFVWGQFSLAGANCWIGGFQSPTSCEPGCGWSWTTGENLTYATWRPGSPDDNRVNGDENCLIANINGLWDDVASCAWCNERFMIEWSADCNNDGIVDYGQILAGTLSDANTNGTPDACECAANPGLPSCCIGDIVADRVINGADLGTLLAYWGPRTTGSFSIASDLNNDGQVDGSDLGILLAYWGACPTANVPVWATVIETQPDPTVVTNAALRAAIVATGLPWRVRDTGTGIEMLLVPPGTFGMGCHQESLNGSRTNPCYANELPVHQVSLTGGFYLGRFEVTQGEWQARMAWNPSAFKSDPDSPFRPVEQVSWFDAGAFLQRTGMRLPTEAEWERACRADTDAPYYNGSADEIAAGELGWRSDNSTNCTHAVGGKLANGLGFHDMLGNVWEWVNDWYGEYADGTQTDPQGATSGTTRSIRGGAWHDLPHIARSSIRHRDIPEITGSGLGFRVARNP
jgi:formylglycine-generating enzyme required for sulfatase activity